MAYKILKQFQPNTQSVWVEKLSADDTIDIFESQEQAQLKVDELTSIDPTREYKIVEI